MTTIAERGWAALILGVWLTACGTTPVVTVPRQVECQPIPEQVTDQVPMPAYQGETNGDLLVYCHDVTEALAACNARLEVVRRLDDRRRE